MPTLLCVPIMVQDEPTAHADAVAAKDAGADIVEFRVDEFFTGSTNPAGELDQREINVILRLIIASPLPCIVTCRSASEGGHYDGDEMCRVALYERLGTAGVGPNNPASFVPGEHAPHYLDFEFSAYSKSANIQQKIGLAIDRPGQRRSITTGLILSLHDFQSRPKDLLRRLSAMQDEPAARVIKVAYTARSIRDNLELFDLLTENAGGRPMVALGMGSFGLLSRVLAPKFNAFLTFASLRENASTAPGQPTLSTLINTYRFRSIGPRTRLLGIMGWPVEHSISPLVHNAGFESLNPDPIYRDLEDEGCPSDAVYLPLPVPPEYEHFKATLGSLIDHPKLDFSGCSVTLPHKQHLVRYAQEQLASFDSGGEVEIEWTIDEISRLCGAANTLVIKRDAMGNARSAHVTNTDAPAAAWALSQTMGDFSGKHVAIIGAGGAARAVAAGVLAAGGNVLLQNRSRAKANALADALRSAHPDWNQPGRIKAADLEDVLRQQPSALVNCTPLGMKGGPAPNESPVSLEELRVLVPARTVVFDTVYTPIQTPLLRSASELGLPTINGLSMFVRQAADQFALWTGQPAPMGLFTRIASEALDS